MKFKILFAAVAVAGLASPLSAQAQGIPDGVAHGAYVGNQEAGPIGAVVGGAVGGVVGGVEGLLGIGPTYASYPVADLHSLQGVGVCHVDVLCRTIRSSQRDALVGLVNCGYYDHEPRLLNGRHARSLTWRRCPRLVGALCVLAQPVTHTRQCDSNQEN